MAPLAGHVSNSRGGKRSCPNRSSVLCANGVQSAIKTGGAETSWNYETVRLGFHRYGKNRAKSGHYAGMYLGDPDIDYVKLAECQGVKGEKVNSQTELEAAMKRGIQATRNGIAGCRD